MENDNNLVQVEDEKGNVLNLLILEQFEYKKKNYAILTEIDKECNCGCKDDECTCDDDCKCKNGGECTCEGDCHCHDDNESLFILEITKDEKGNEIFKSIDDEKLFNEVVDKAEELFNE